MQTKCSRDKFFSCFFACSFFADSFFARSFFADSFLKIFAFPGIAQRKIVILGKTVWWDHWWVEKKVLLFVIMEGVKNLKKKLFVTMVYVKNILGKSCLSVWWMPKNMKKFFGVCLYGGCQEYEKSFCCLSVWWMPRI